ncbi:hypothetical protein K438DRAFT_650433 [Mycena galopus ATCC 62051]|nr:hypothetical protein K438DRAFT_650433 [Mycena galopus ATCC 62051]
MLPLTSSSRFPHGMQYGTPPTSYGPPPGPRHPGPSTPPRTQRNLRPRPMSRRTVARPRCMRRPLARHRLASTRPILPRQVRHRAHTSRPTLQILTAASARRPSAAPRSFALGPFARGCCLISVLSTPHALLYRRTRTPAFVFLLHAFQRMYLL